MDEKRTWKQEFYEMVRILVIALLIVVPIRLFVAQPFVVKGASMEPTFKDGQYLVVDELSYRFHNPNRGDVIVLRYPLDPEQYFIKRIIGLPGEIIVIRDGNIYIRTKGSDEEKMLDEQYLNDSIKTEPERTVTLGSDEFFVMGDNRAHSSDSRFWGALERQFVVGKALVRLWPLNTLGVF